MRGDNFPPCLFISQSTYLYKLIDSPKVDKKNWFYKLYIPFVESLNYRELKVAIAAAGARNTIVYHKQHPLKSI